MSSILFGRIDEKGRLWIMRGGKFKLQYCRQGNATQENPYCSDDCPLFGEPEQEKDCDSDYIFKLELCNKELVFDPDMFEDQRGITCI